MELKSGDLFFYKKFLWKNQRGDREGKNEEEKSAKRSKVFS